jgi:hypothetical protein
MHPSQAGLPPLEGMHTVKDIKDMNGVMDACVGIVDVDLSR